MYEALRELFKDEIEEEIQKAETRAAQEATKKATDATWIEAIKNLMQKLSLDAKAAMEALDISAADQLRYMPLLQSV